jgi:hypothetical protein
MSLQTANCVCSILCECERSYIGETGRPLAMWICEHRQPEKGSSREMKTGPTCLLREEHRMKPVFWKLEITAGIESTRNQLIQDSISVS